MPTQAAARALEAHTGCRARGRRRAGEAKATTFRVGRLYLSNSRQSRDPAPLASRNIASLKGGLHLRGHHRSCQDCLVSFRCTRTITHVFDDTDAPRAACFSTAIFRQVRYPHYAPESVFACIWQQTHLRQNHRRRRCSPAARPTSSSLLQMHSFKLTPSLGAAARTRNRRQVGPVPLLCKEFKHMATHMATSAEYCAQARAGSPARQHITNEVIECATPTWM